MDVQDMKEQICPLMKWETTTRQSVNSNFQLHIQATAGKRKNKTCIKFSSSEWNLILICLGNIPASCLWFLIFADCGYKPNNVNALENSMQVSMVM